MFTRLDCMLGSAGLMQMALAQAAHHACNIAAHSASAYRAAADAQCVGRPGAGIEAATAFALRVAVR